MKKELLESILKLVPKDWTIEIEVKGTKGQALLVTFIRFDHTTDIVYITLADEYNLS